MKFDDAPRLTKLPFILGDIALLLLAGFIAARHSDPLSPIPLLVITGCVVVGVAVFMIPYIVNDARDKEDAAASLRQELSEQFKRLITASEHLQHATIQLKSIEEASTKSVESAEKLPYRLQEKIAEFNQQLADAGNKEKTAIEQELTRLRSEESERLSKVAGQIAQSLADWSKIEAGARQQFADTITRERELFGQQLAKALSTENERLVAAADDVARVLAGWAKTEADARQNLAAMAEQEKESLALQAATLRSADNERQAAATAQITTALAEWTKIETDARQSLAAMMRREKELFQEQAVTLRSTDRERQTAAAAQIANALAEWARIEADARLGLASMVQREKELMVQQVGTLRSTENERLAAAAEEITMTLASWTGIEAGVRRQLAAAAEMQGRLAEVLSGFDGKIAGLQAAVESAAKAAEAFPSAQPQPAIVRPAPAPAEAEPIVAGSEPVKPVAVTPAPIAAGPVSTAEPMPEVLSSGWVVPEKASPESRPLEAIEPPTTVAPEAPVIADQTPALAETPPAVEPVSATPEVIAPPAPPEPPAATVAPAEPAVVDAPPSVPVSEVTPTPPPPEPPAATEALVNTTVADTPPPVSAPEVAPSSELPLAIEPTPEVAAATAPLESPAADSPPANMDESESPPVPSDASDAVASSKPRKPRAPKKPKSEGSAPAEPAAGGEPGSESPIVRPPPVELISEPVVDEPPAPESFSQLPPEENKPAANRSADGRTRLTVTSYIGIGNKLHLRGEGPGLSWNKGVPLQFVSIGRWRWETDAATAPVTCRIYKNDRLEAPIGLLTLAPGTEQEVSAQF